MKKKHLYALWGLLYLICTGLGFVREPEGVGRGLLIASGVLFFLPGFWLLFRFRKEENRKGLKGLRILSALSLGLTVLLLILNFLSLSWSTAAGRILYVLLILVSSPMICIRYWVLSLFLWACILIGSFLKKPVSPR